MHFEQVFRCARKTHLVEDKTKLIFLGFGTVNGKDGKPYILYTVVRIGSILNKYMEEGNDNSENKIKVGIPSSKSERDLMLKLTRFNEMIEASFTNYAPHKICQYIYEVSNSFNHFYHEHNILKEQDKIKKVTWINLITLTQAILIISLDLLGIEVPEKM